MKVEEVLTQLDSLVGNEITIEGFLVERAPEYYFYLAPDEESIDEFSRSILVVLPLPRREFENRLPGILVGSRYGFANSATITGRLIRSDSRAFPAALTALTHMTARSRQENKEIDVLLDP